jgi:hypothetical protein
MERESAAMAAFLTLEPPTGPMRREASSAGFYRSPLNGQEHARLQILTIEELLNGRKLDYPGWRDPHANVTLRRPPRSIRRGAVERSLLDSSAAARMGREK